MSESIQFHLTKKLSKQERRLQKKQNRCLRLLQEHEGLHLSSEPTKILCVSNAGLDNGVTNEKVEQMFSIYGTIDAIIMPPMKSYCFVCYAVIDDAMKATALLNGTNLSVSSPDTAASCAQTVSIYIAFVDKVPECIVPSNNLPPGLILLKDFITEAYEERLLESVCWEQQTPDHKNASSSLKNRRVMHYGYEFLYSINNVDPASPLDEKIPAVCDDLIDRLIDGCQVRFRPDQLTVNRYEPGQGIPIHVDTPSAFEDGIISLSLGSQAVMEFKHPDGNHLSVLLPRRSVIVMTGESRYIWAHGLTPRKSDIVPTENGGLTLCHRQTRTSFTFRKIVMSPQKSSVDDPGQSLPVTELEAVKLESDHVHSVYDEIADHFSATRHSPWPRIAEFVRSQPPGSILIDIGCGNGKYLGLNSCLYEIGSDRSVKLSGICEERRFQVVIADILHLPFKSSCCDVCLCIAVIHHLSTWERRRKAVSELVRILRPGGQVIMHVWAMEQEMKNVKSKYIQKMKGRSRDKSHTDAGQASAYSEDPRLNRTNKDASCSSADDNKHSELLDDMCGANVLQTHNSAKFAQDGQVPGDDIEKNASSENQSIDRADVSVSDSYCSRGDDTHFKPVDKACDPNLLQDFNSSQLSEAEHVSGHNHMQCGTVGASIERDMNIISESYNSGYKENVEGSDISISTRPHPDEASVTSECTENASNNIDVSNSKSSNNASKKSLPIHVNRTPFIQQDMLLPWQLKSKGADKNGCGSVTEKGDNSVKSINKQTFYRFYHVFKEGELEQLCDCLDMNVTIVDRYYDQGNWCVILRKDD